MKNIFKNTYKYVNTREFKRLRSYCLVRYKFMDNQKKELKIDFTTTKDISAGGVVIRSNKVIPAGTLIEMEIKVPNLEGIINAVGEVVRVDKKEDVGIYEAGVSFTKITEKDQLEIKNYISVIAEKVGKNNLLGFRKGWWRRRIKS